MPTTARPIPPHAAPGVLPRLRAAVVGGTGAGTGILAHTLGHGALPGGGGLLVVLAAGVGLGVLAGGRSTGTTSTAPGRLLTLLAGGQVLVHLLLLALAGHHQELITGPMAAVHTVGTLVAFGLIVSAESLVRALSGRARRVAALCTSRPTIDRITTIVVVTPPRRPQRLRQLGTVGTRGPPALV
ncbi:hypothetical protein MUG78_10455 [Gordonia alkaliphila]|uniref:hypothetical protein n=1 Tax=Gordonia alkaliphila TaxID=1053547 RepID=UPI001FF55580|nr:hypothetical protein [Gordonia alkaliphila]MCK0439866.1 hypothetical protein [Gordonia alkaliphila]